jgi:hypothetical protein
MSSVQAAGEGIQAIGDISAGQAKAQALRASAEVQRRNAAEAIEASQFDAARQGIIASQKIGAATAAYGASGVAGDSGSVMNVTAAAHANAELDRLNILHGGDIRAINYRNQASMDETAAQNSELAGYIGAVGSAFGGAGKFYGNRTAARAPADDEIEGD